MPSGRRSTSRPPVEIHVESDVTHKAGRFQDARSDSAPAIGAVLHGTVSEQHSASISTTGASETMHEMGAEFARMLVVSAKDIMVTVTKQIEESQRQTSALAESSLEQHQRSMEAMVRALEGRLAEQIEEVRAMRPPAYTTVHEDVQALESRVRELIDAMQLGQQATGQQESSAAMQEEDVAATCTRNTTASARNEGAPRRMCSDLFEATVTALEARLQAMAGAIETKITENVTTALQGVLPDIPRTTPQEPLEEDVSVSSSSTLKASVLTRGSANVAMLPGSSGEGALLELLESLFALVEVEPMTEGKLAAAVDTKLKSTLALEMHGMRVAVQDAMEKLIAGVEASLLQHSHRLSVVETRLRHFLPAGNDDIESGLVRLGCRSAQSGVNNLPAVLEEREDDASPRDASCEPEGVLLHGAGAS